MRGDWYDKEDALHVWLCGNPRYICYILLRPSDIYPEDAISYA